MNSILKYICSLRIKLGLWLSNTKPKILIDDVNNNEDIVYPTHEKPWTIEQKAAFIQAHIEGAAKDKKCKIENIGAHLEGHNVIYNPTVENLYQYKNPLGKSLLIVDSKNAIIITK